MNYMTTIVIPVTKTEKIRLERRAKKFGYALGDFTRLAVEQFVPELATKDDLDWDNLPTEDISLFKPSFVRKLKQSLREMKDGKVTKVESLLDL